MRNPLVSHEPEVEQDDDDDDDWDFDSDLPTESEMEKEAREALFQSHELAKYVTKLRCRVDEMKSSIILVIEGLFWQVTTNVKGWDTNRCPSHINGVEVNDVMHHQLQRRLDSALTTSGVDSPEVAKIFNEFGISQFSEMLRFMNGGEPELSLPPDMAGDKAHSNFSETLQTIVGIEKFHLLVPYNLWKTWFDGRKNRGLRATYCQPPL